MRLNDLKDTASPSWHVAPHRSSAAGEPREIWFGKRVDMSIPLFWQLGGQASGQEMAHTPAQAKDTVVRACLDETLKRVSGYPLCS